jgi:hypothetical protein
MSKARQLADLGNVYDDGALSNRNLIINGAMQVAQRGTSFVVPPNGTYTLDRFKPYFTTTHDQLSPTVTQSSDAPDGFSNSLMWTTTTAETTVDADELAYVWHMIEAQNCQQLAYGTSSAKEVTLSFWVKSSIAGTYSVSIYAGDASKVIGTTYSVASTNTWEYKTLTFSGNSADVINNDNGEGLRINWVLGAGSDYTASNNTSWVSYSDAVWAYGHAANALVTTSGATWQITGVQLEVGDTATPFEHRSYGDELARCQRYCVVLSGAAYKPYGFIGWCESSTRAKSVYNFPVPMRSTPSFTRTGSWMYDGATSNPSSASTNNASSTPYMCRLEDNISGGNTGEGIILINNNDATATITFDAEL